MISVWFSRGRCAGSVDHANVPEHDEWGVDFDEVRASVRIRRLSRRHDARGQRHRADPAHLTHSTYLTHYTTSAAIAARSSAPVAPGDGLVHPPGDGRQHGQRLRAGGFEHQPHVLPRHRQLEAGAEIALRHLVAARLDHAAGLELSPIRSAGLSLRSARDRTQDLGEIFEEMGRVAFAALSRS